MTDVTVCIPTIPPRRSFLQGAIQSVAEQTIPALWAVATDDNREGAWATRNRAAAMAKTEWIAFLDDDDRLMPHHIAHLLECAEQHQADMTWGWFQTIGGRDPFPKGRGKQYNPAAPHVVPITYLIRREVFEATDGFRPDVPGTTHGSWQHQDQSVFDQVHRLTDGAMYASDMKTWWWRHHALNTSGLPTRWK